MPIFRWCPRPGPHGNMNTHFQFKQFRIEQSQCAMKVSTDACLFGAWVSRFLKEREWPSQPAPRVLDIGAGTGLLSLMIRQEWVCEVTAVELDPAAAQQCAGNFKESPWAFGMNAIEADICGFTSDIQFDCIVSNPPFFADDLPAPGKERNQARHEQGLRLTSLLEAAQSLISESGWIFLMYPARRLGDVLETAAAFGLNPAEIVSVAHSEMHPVSRHFYALQRRKINTRQVALCLRDASGVYSPEFKRLLEPYYLDRLLNSTA